MGILPLQFTNGEDADSLGFNGKEQFSIPLNGGNLKVSQTLTVKASNGTNFECLVRLDTEPEVNFWRNGGILHFVLRNIAKRN
jgi:aconitate hydratase